jgi:hypothetical protein
MAPAAAAVIFEGMCALVLHDVLHTDLLLDAVLLNLIWMALAALGFLLRLRSARARGLLPQIGERKGVSSSCC